MDKKKGNEPMNQEREHLKQYLKKEGFTDKQISNAFQMFSNFKSFEDAADFAYSIKDRQTEKIADTLIYLENMYDLSFLLCQENEIQ